MPYYITDSAEGCEGWATIKGDGEVLGCHINKQDAIDQMIALSVAEEIEPGGERALPDNYRPALSEDVPEGRACGNCRFYNEEMVQENDGEIKAFCEKWDEYVRGDNYCDAWSGEQEQPENSSEEQEETERKENKNMAIEYRQFHTEIRQEGDGHTFEGYAAIFDAESEGLAFREVIRPGAFSKSVAAANRGEWEVKALQDHDPKYFLGSTKTGTLSLQEDDRGLKVRVSLNPEVTFASDLAAMLRRDGAAMGMSFGFSVPSKGDAYNDEGVRELKNVRLHEVSLLTGHEPAYPATIGLGAVRSLSNKTEIAPDRLMRAIDTLLAGSPDEETATTLQEAIKKVAPELVRSNEDVETQETAEEVDDRPIPLSVRERQLALASLEIKQPNRKG